MKKIIIITIIIILGVIGVVFGYYSFSSAQSPLIFGGVVLNSQYCSCSGNFLLTLSAPTPGQWVWYPGTPQFANMQLPRMGVWSLGLYTPGGACLGPSGKGCAPIGAPIGTIGPITGTSF